MHCYDNANNSNSDDDLVLLILLITIILAVVVKLGDFYKSYFREVLILSIVLLDWNMMEMMLVIMDVEMIKLVTVSCMYSVKQRDRHGAQPQPPRAFQTARARRASSTRSSRRNINCNDKNIFYCLDSAYGSTNNDGRKEKF